MSRSAGVVAATLLVVLSWQPACIAPGILGPGAANPGKIVNIQSAIPYAARGETSLKFDIFTPGDSTGHDPFIINIFGGGWIQGDRAQLGDFSYDFAAHGYTTAQIDYRLAGNGVTYVDQVVDVLEAIRFFKANADQYGIDPDRILLFGASSGAQIALLAGMTNDTSLFDPTRPQGEIAGIKAVINLFGATDLTVNPPPTSPAWVIPMLDSALGKPFDQAGDLRILGSPIRYVRSDGPAILTMHGSADSIVPVEEARAFQAALAAAGEKHVYDEVFGMDHIVGAIWDLWYAQDFRPTMFAFLQDNL